MIVSELYEKCDDISDFTKIKVYDCKTTGRFMDFEMEFNGTFNDMPIEVRQSDVVMFSYDYSQDTLVAYV